MTLRLMNLFSDTLRAIEYRRNFPFILLILLITSGFHRWIAELIAAAKYSFRISFDSLTFSPLLIFIIFKDDISIFVYHMQHTHFSLFKNFK